MSSPTVAVVSLPVQCQCEHHCFVHPASGVYPPCDYAEVLEIAMNSKGDSNFSVTKVPEPDKVVLMEDNGWFVEKNPSTSQFFSLHESRIGHYCPTLRWKTYLNEKIMMVEGVCNHCMERVPPGLIALWKMHNWEYLQNTPHHDEAEVDEACIA